MLDGVAQKGSYDLGLASVPGLPTSGVARRSPMLGHSMGTLCLSAQSAEALKGV